MGRSKLPAGTDFPEYLPGIVISADRYVGKAGAALSPLTPELVEEAATQARIGVKRRFIASMVGCTESQFRTWIREGMAEWSEIERWRAAGSDGEQPKATMRLGLAVEVARAEAQVVGQLTAAVSMSGDPNAQLRLLKSLQPRHYTENAGSAVDDETGEATATGAELFSAMLGKLKNLSHYLNDEGDDGD